jgi:hypothetical protein
VEHEINSGHNDVEEPAVAATDNTRRDALRKIGIYGAFTTPVLMGLLKADAALAASPIGEPIQGECSIGPPPTCTFS